MDAIRPALMDIGETDKIIIANVRFLFLANQLI
jgi:hypothetical protein